jgi:hypothetical protein
MARACNVCGRSDRTEIDSALVSAEPIRAISRRTGLSKDGLRRHRESHLPISLVRVAADEEQDRAEGLIGEVQSLLDEARAILADEREAGRSTVALNAIEKAGKLLELRARLSGELDERPITTINLLADKAWVQVRSATVAVLRVKHPDALPDVQAVWRELAAGE